jgi:branched-chain amino acid transport system substrate-binding protein
MRRPIALSATLLLAGLVAGCGSEGGKGKTLKVGVILPMTMDQATYGVESWNGILLAEEDLKKDAKLPSFTLIRRDEKSDKTQAGLAAKDLIETEQVHVLLGTVASSNTAQIFREAREGEVPAISPASTNDKLTAEGGPFTSRICFKDSFQGTVLAEFALGQGWKRAAVVVDKAQVYSTGLAENFKTAFEAKGGKVGFEYYTTQDTDFSNVIQNVANQGPDVIFISGYYAQAGPMIKQAKGKWDGKPVIGGDGLDSPDLIKLAGDTKTEIYLTSHFAADGPDPEVRAFAERYAKRFGEPPGAMAALGYDLLFVLMDAVKRCADPTDRAQLAKAIAATKDLKGITGTMDLTTPDRTPVKDVVIVKVEGGFKYHSTVKAK